MTKLYGKVRLRKGIRRFVDDILSMELKESIREMATTLGHELTRKVMASKK